MKQSLNKLKSLLTALIVLVAPQCWAGHDPGFLAAMGGSIQPENPDQYNFYEGQCTSYAAWRLNQAGIPFHNYWRSGELANCPAPGNGTRPAGAYWNAGRWSHAWQWYYKARHLGIPINTTPVVNAIYCSLSDSSYGHVGVVQSVNADGSALIAEYNWRGTQQYSTRNNVRVNGTTAFYIHFITPSPTSDDHGNSTATATNISLNASYNGRIEINGDRDYFRFSVTSTQNIVAASAGSTDVVCELLAANGGLITSDDDSGGNSQFRIARQLTPGTYFLAVRGYGSTVGSYGVSVTGQIAPPPPPPNGDDHGNTIGSASVLQLGGSTNGRLETSQDVDFFRINMPYAGNFTIQSSSGIDLIADLYNNNGTLLATDDDSAGNLQFRFAGQFSQGTFYVRVRGYGGAVGNYTVSIR